MSARLTEAQVERLRRVSHNLAKGQKRHPDTAEAMDILSQTLRMCARCGASPVLGGVDDLTCCDRCASDIGHDVATEALVVRVGALIDEWRGTLPRARATRAAMIRDLRAALEDDQ